MQREHEPASIQWNPEEVQDVFLRNIHLSCTEEGKEEPLPRQPPLSKWCPKLCYGRCPSGCKRYSSIERGTSKRTADITPACPVTTRTPCVSKRKTATADTQPDKRARAPRDKTLADTDVGARIKRTRTKEDQSSDKTEQILIKLKSTHLSNELAQQQPNTRTVQEYADSGEQ